MKKLFLVTLFVISIPILSQSQDFYKWEINAGTSYYPKGLFRSILYLNVAPGRHPSLTLQLAGGQVGLLYNIKPGLGIGINSNFSNFYFNFEEDSGQDGSFLVNHNQKSHSIYARFRTNPKRKLILYGQPTLNITSLKRSFDYGGNSISTQSLSELGTYFSKSQLNFSPGLLVGIEKRFGSRMALYLQFGYDDILGLIDKDEFYFSIEGQEGNPSEPTSGQGLFYDQQSSDMTVVGVEKDYLPYHFDLGLIIKLGKDKF